MSFDNNWLYSDVVKQHFMQPKNILRGNEQDFNWDGKGITGNIKCGDQMAVYITVDKEKGTISDCKWQTYGCASAIASTSVMSEMVKGMTLEDAFNLSPKDIAQKLGGLPDNKVHCSVLGDKALRMAINNYYSENDMRDKVSEDYAQMICECMEVTDHEIEEAVLEGARTFYGLQEMTKIGTGCGGCEEKATELMKSYIAEHFPENQSFSNTIQ